MLKTGSIAREAPGLRPLLWKTLGAVAFLFALLEFWRPCFFLTDDNLDGAFPRLVGMGRDLLAGHSIFITDQVFGGHYNLLRDSTYFAWHPIYVLASLAANSPARFFSVDLIALFFFAVAAAGFVCLADHLRRELALPLSDRRLLFYTLSFTFSMIALCIGSSWVSFIGNYSAMPWLALGILQTQWKPGVALVTAASLHEFLGGHLAGDVSTSFFLTLFALGVAAWRRSPLPGVSWFAGCGIAALIISPLALPMMAGFVESARSGGLAPGQISEFAVPLELFPFSFFFSAFSVWLHIPYQFGQTELAYSAAFVSCAAAWALIPALTSRSRWTGLQALCLGLALLAALFVIRPTVLNAAMAHTPLLRSLRWPFREILQVQFFFHLFLVVRPMTGSRGFQRGLIGIGLAIFLLPLPLLPAPSFDPMDLDRDLLFTGEADRYWAQVKTLLGPEDRIIPVCPPEFFNGPNMAHLPLSLLGAANYPMLFQVQSATGYSQTPPRDQLYLQVQPIAIWGIYHPLEKPLVLQERPNVRFITVEKLQPLVLTLSTKNGPPVSLIPFLDPPSRPSSP